jgi:ABC-type sugar transport systems, ATPase components
MSTLSLKHLRKVYDGGVTAVKDFDMEIADGEFIVFVGPSGCGKTTTLRMIAGLESITDGQLLIGDKDMTSKPAKERDIAMVFQNYALYANMTVYQNLSFSLMLRKQNPEDIHRKVMDAARIIGLMDQLNKKPKELSGGQRQRVAMGRAVVRNPKVFLFDEPLSNLDAKLRNSMRREIKLLHHNLGTTMVYVTHDQIEALTLADRIVVMSMGEVQQIGKPLEIYNHPANLFVASFIGNPPMNFIQGSIENGKFVAGAFTKELSSEETDLLSAYVSSGKSLVFAFRPEAVVAEGPHDFQVELVEHLGQSSLIHGTLSGFKTVLKLRGWHRLLPGDIVKIGFTPSLIRYFDAESGQAIRKEGLPL